MKPNMKYLYAHEAQSHLGQGHVTLPLQVEAPFSEKEPWAAIALNLLFLLSSTVLFKNLGLAYLRW